MIFLICLFVFYGKSNGGRWSWFLCGAWEISRVGEEVEGVGGDGGEVGGICCSDVFVCRVVTARFFVFVNVEGDSVVNGVCVFWLNFF